MPTAQTETTTFDNGFSVISKQLPGARSVALGLWLFNGSRHETPEQQGYAHLLEHLLFKGCATLDAKSIARLTDRWGGQFNAFTGRELTALHNWVPARHQAELAALLTDMLLHPRFDADDLAAEQAVVLQEIAAQQDAPDEAAESAAVELACQGNPLGREILGIDDAVRGATVQDMQAYRQNLLQGSRLALVAVGAVDHTALCRAATPLASLPRGARPRVSAPLLTGGEQSLARDHEQTQLVWVLPAPAIDAAAYPIAALANQLLGGSVSSRLFQEVRERLGLVYDIHSGVESFADCGLWIIQTACEPRNARQCRQAVEACIRSFIDQGPTLEELDDAREYLAAILALEEDTLEAHMEHLAREYFYLGRHPSLQERIQTLLAVRPEQIIDLLQQAWAAHWHLHLGTQNA